jgi:hypothetical protein
VPGGRRCSGRFRETPLPRALRLSRDHGFARRRLGGISLAAACRPANRGTGNCSVHRPVQGLRSLTGFAGARCSSNRALACGGRAVWRAGRSGQLSRADRPIRGRARQLRRRGARTRLGKACSPGAARHAFPAT